MTGLISLSGPRFRTWCSTDPTKLRHHAIDRVNELARPPLYAQDVIEIATSIYLSWTQQF